MPAFDAHRVACVLGFETFPEETDWLAPKASACTQFFGRCGWFGRRAANLAGGPEGLPGGRFGKRSRAAADVARCGIPECGLGPTPRRSIPDRAGISPVSPPLPNHRGVAGVVPTLAWDAPPGELGSCVPTPANPPCHSRSLNDRRRINQRKMKSITIVMQ